jgi:peptidylamidoglycolate lyase
MSTAFGQLFKISCVMLAVSLPAYAAGPGYEVVKDWPSLPKDHVLGLCAGVGVDSHNHVWVFHRCGRSWTKPFATEPITEPTISIIDGASGKLLRSWGANLFIMPHGLSIDHDDNVWLTDVALHQVFKFTNDGKRLLALGERGISGADHAHFNLPTDIAVLPDGSFYVSDGYKNTRVVKFSAEGKYELEWGGKGSGVGEFNLPHGIALDASGRIYVCDRSNARLQVFDSKGEFITAWKGEQIGRPFGVAVNNEGHVFIVDGGEQSSKPTDHGKVVELSASGDVLASFGTHGSGIGQFRTGHDIAVGADGAIYVAEGGGKRVQKFVRKH